jgi:hypothetical protein
MAQHTAAAAGGDEEVAEAEAAAAAAAGSTLRHRHAGKGAEEHEAAGGGGGGRNGGADDPDATSVERVFADKAVPSWREQLTLRAFVVSALLAVMFSVIVMKLNLTTGIIPSLNVSAGLLGFFFVRLWTSAVERIGLLKQPFTRQENTVIQTCVVSAYGIAFSGKRLRRFRLYSDFYCTTFVGLGLLVAASVLCVLMSTSELNGASIRGIHLVSASACYNVTLTGGCDFGLWLCGSMMQQI